MTHLTEIQRLDRLLAETRAELDVLRTERDAAIARAEAAERDPPMAIFYNLRARVALLERVVDAARAHDERIVWEESERDGSEWDLHLALAALDAEPKGEP